MNEMARHAATVKNTRLNTAAASSAAGESAPPNRPDPAGSIAAVAPSTMTPSNAMSIVVNRLREKFMVPTAMPS